MIFERDEYMKLGIYEVLKLASEQKTKAQKIEVLRKHNTPCLQTILIGAYDDGVVWLLPETDPPYKPNDLVDQQNIIYTEIRKLYLFVKGGNDTLAQSKREKIFIDFLESIDKDDAKVILSIKNKKLPFKNLTKSLIIEAFPESFLAQQKAE